MRRIWGKELAYQQRPFNIYFLLNSSTNFQEVSAVLTDKGSVQKIRGIGFDATCSLVALDSTGHAVTVSPSREPHRNIIMWLDHRALDQAQRINNTKHKVLSYVGGGVSPEMETPKILWLKENLPDDCWEKCAIFLELPEFLTYKATGDQTRWELEEQRLVQLEAMPFKFLISHLKTIFKKNLSIFSCQMKTIVFIPVEGRGVGMGYFVWCGWVCATRVSKFGAHFKKEFPFKMTPCCSDLVNI